MAAKNEHPICRVKAAKRPKGCLEAAQRMRLESLLKVVRLPSLALLIVTQRSKTAGLGERSE